jgi:hypothetical protein
LYHNQPENNGKFIGQPQQWLVPGHMVFAGAGHALGTPQKSNGRIIERNTAVFFIRCPLA